MSDPLREVERDYVRWYPTRIRPMGPEEAWPPRTAGLYLHIPFCVHRCHFCRYKIVAGKGLEPRIASYLGTLLRELDTVRRLPGLADVHLDVVFLGGGTPSLLDAQQLADLVDAVKARFPLTADCEVTLEANPSSLDGERLAAARAAGVNRLTLGVQSFSDQVLTDIGRDHTGEEAYRCVRLAQSFGFDNLNLDLIYRLPGQSREGLLESIRTAIELGPAHLSFYPLWVREGTVFHQRLQDGELTLPGDQEEEAMLASAIELLAANGYDQYNVFDFVRDRALRSRYTLHQWEDGQWIGLGPSSISYFTGRHLLNAYSLEEYTELVEATGLATTSGQFLTQEDRMRRTLIFGLRMIPFEGERFRRQYGVPVDLVFADELALLEREGLLQRSGDDWRLTVRGIRRINNIGKLFYGHSDERQTLGLRHGRPIEESDF